MGIGTGPSTLGLTRTRAYREVSGAWDAPAALACSGGVDSTALLLLAFEAARRGKVAPFIVMHVDHGTRPGSDTEGRFVARLCQERNLPFVPLRVEATGSVHGRSDEDVWRERRYRMLTLAMRRLRIGVLLTAHTRNDQVETVLMRALAGSGRLGMGAQTELQADGHRVRLCRPLLTSTRTELEDVLSIAGVSPLIDPSNVDLRFLRNAIRHEVIPVLERVSPGFESTLLRAAALHERDANYCDTVALDAFEAICLMGADSEVVAERRMLRQLHPAIATRVIRLAWRAIGDDADEREVGFERLEAVRGALDGRSGAVIQLPGGVDVYIERDIVRFVRDDKGLTG